MINKNEQFLMNLENRALAMFQTLREAVDYAIGGDRDILYDYLENGESLIDLYKDYEHTIYAHSDTQYPKSILYADVFYVLEPSTLLYLKEKFDM